MKPLGKGPWPENREHWWNARWASSQTTNIKPPCYQSSCEIDQTASVKALRWGQTLACLRNDCLLFILPLWDFQSYLYTNTPFLWVTKIIRLSKSNGKFSVFTLPCSSIWHIWVLSASWNAFLYFAPRAPLFLSLSLTHWFSSLFLHCWFWTSKCWSSPGFKAQPSST